MDFGMPTLIELSNIDDCVSLCRDLKLQFIEINMNMPQYQVNRLDINALKRALDDGIYFTFHLDENVNISDFNDKVSAAYVETILSTMQIAEEVNAPVINMHMPEGVRFKLPNEKIYLFDRYNGFYMGSFNRFRELCEKQAAGTNVKICIENTFGYLPFQVKAIEYLIESETFGLTYDIGHDYCAQNADEGFILAHEGKLRHMHIHDGLGDKCHLVLGTGEIDINGKLSLARSHNCRCVTETKSVSGLRDSIAYLRGLNIRGEV